MAYDQTRNGRIQILRPLAGAGSRVAASALRPLSGVMAAAVGAGISLERQAMVRVLDSAELEHILITTIDSAHLQATLRRALESDGAKRLVDGLFDSGLVDRLLERLETSDALWHLIDVIAASPTVTAAISQQGLGFADQVGEAARQRSRNADDWLERSAHRLLRRPRKGLAADPEPNPG